jgi:hypothetical protein
VVNNEIRIEWYDTGGGGNPITIESATLLTLSFNVVDANHGSAVTNFTSRCVIGSAVGEAIVGTQFVDGQVRFGGSVAVESQLTPRRLELQPARPNPFSLRTSLSFALPRDGRVRLELFDLHGRLVRRLVNGSMIAGFHAAEFDGRDDRGIRLLPGVYHAQLTHDGVVAEHRKVVILQ